LKFSPIDAIALILETLKFERDTSRLECFITPDQLQNYFSTLQENCLLVYEQEKQSYKTTDKGMHFLEIYREVEGLVTPKGV